MNATALPLDDVAALSAGLRGGAFSSVEIVSEALARIRVQDGWLHAFAAVHEDEALAAAEVSDRMLRSGQWLSPLHGIPVALKDLIDVAGHPTTCGSPLFAERRAERSANIVDRLRAAGAIPIGKTHMVQFALGAWGTNEHMGTPRNPWDHRLHRTPGGSSSGSAVAVAAGLVPLAIGTDTGGSVRVPAAFCGITGLKATAGRIDATGVLPLSTTLDSIGVFARSAADAALLYGVLADDAGAAQPSRHGDAGAFAGCRLGRLAEAELDGVAPEVRAAYEAALELFARGGAQICMVEMPRSLDAFAQTASAIMLSEGAADYGELTADPAAQVDSSVRPRLAAGMRVGAVQYVRAMRQRLAWKREFALLLSGIDALVTPTTPGTAIPIEEVDHDKAPVRYTRVLNLLDMCGISLPAGFDAQGLPIGIQIGALEGREASLIAVATRFQQHTDFHLRTPAVRSV